jgi:hypothetical protein
VRPVDRDPCLFTCGIPAEAGTAPACSVLQAIGTHAFDPDTDLDQAIARAVLDRMWPVLRFATDAGTWLIRDAQRWAPRADLSGWAVATVADLMPPGDPHAPQHSQQRRRAERRRRLRGATGAAAVAAKIRALAVEHPTGVRLADLDSDPNLVWAGGIAWDLPASTDRPAPSTVDPGTPHLHSAGFAPDPHRPTPYWDALLAAVWPDPAVRAWALRVLSIAVTGHPVAVPMLYGRNGRGKHQVARLLMSVLGSYAHTGDPRLLGAPRHAHPSIVSALQGRRLVFIDDGPRPGAAAQEWFKHLTGGGPLTGHRLRENPVTFTPTHTLVLAVTPDTALPLTDAGIRARVRLIPCDGDPTQISAAHTALDNTTWQAEAPGVLAQLMRQAGRWLANPHTTETTAAPDPVRHLTDQLTPPATAPHHCAPAVPARCGRSDHHDAEQCPRHGCPICLRDDQPAGACTTCDQACDDHYDRQWPETVVDPATGHDGEDCTHCTVCDTCQGTGTVCRWCQRCTQHQTETGADCEQLRWDTFVRAERTYWVHSTFDKTTRRWSP